MHRSLSREEQRPALLKSLPFFIMHLIPFAMIWTGARAIDFAVCFGLYFVRMFFITGVYHRYFAHRAYKMGRVMQFAMALGGSTAAQKGPLWWAGHHRKHHKYSDLVQDTHSPKDGFWWSHVGWIISTKYDETEFDRIKDFAKYPELRLLNQFHLVPPVLLGLAVWWFGGWSMLVVGFFLSTVLLYHGTFTINSLAHVIGKRRYVTTDTSKNSFILALITLGEGWHNNHHYYQSTANQGFFWWEVDISYYILRALSWVGLTYDLRTPPKHVLTRNLVSENEDIGMLPEPGVVAAEIAKPTRTELLSEEAAVATRASVIPPAVVL